MKCDEVSNECWSSEMGGAKRRSHMGPPHKSYFHRYREMGDISINGYGRGLFYVFPEERGILWILLKSGEFSGFMRKNTIQINY